MRFHKTDGGREAAGYKGKTGDCAIRAIAICTGEPYKEVYGELYDIAKGWTGRSKIAKAIRSRPSPRGGVYQEVVQKYLESRGWKKVTGNRKLNDPYFDKGTFICSIRRHYTSVIDGELYDAFDCQLTKGYYAPVTTCTVFHFFEKEGDNA